MATRTEILEQNQRVIDLLKKAGVRASFYTRPPLNKETFTLSMDNKNEIRIWPGIAEIQIHSGTGDSRRLKQAVITASERRREITETLNLVRRGPNWKPQLAIDYSQLRLPESAKTRISKSEFDPEVQDGDWRGMWTIELVHVVPASVQSFLVGTDESSQFVSALPKPCKTLEEAHRALRPKGVPLGCPRQGEWFFVPVSASVAKKLGDRAAQATGGVFGTPIFAGRLEGGSSHWGHILTRLDKQLYATGLIRDSRKGRHEPLWLDGWHKVVRNTELRTNPTTSTTYWD